MFIVLHHVCEYSTPLVKRFCHNIIEAVTNIKFRSQPEQNKTSRYSITDDSISKYDDVMDLTDAPNINTSYRSAESDVIQT